MTKRKSHRNGSVTKDDFKAEVGRWGDEIGVEIAEVHVRSMKHKWGSCSSNGRLTFDAELLDEPEEFRNEVIVHEVLHLKVPNHGRLFRSLLRAFLGRTTLESVRKAPSKTAANQKT
ncbi:MAG: M48 family metallopeptidase [Planctomycetaceae bacterium]|nr:M48 family metallopeptidase [Planctomycetaceae bacterium]